MLKYSRFYKIDLCSICQRESQREKIWKCSFSILVVLMENAYKCFYGQIAFEIELKKTASQQIWRRILVLILFIKFYGVLGSSAGFFFLLNNPFNKSAAFVFTSSLVAGVAVLVVSVGFFVFLLR